MSAYNLGAMSASSTDRRMTILLLSVVLLLSAVVRIYFASYDLGPKRFWDERYSLRNVQKIFATGTLVPQNAYYPLLAHLPQYAVLAAAEKVHSWTGGDESLVFDRRGRFSKHSYLMVRLVAVGYSLVGLWLTYLVGRRLFDVRVGLLGALILSGIPWHARSAVNFKPDALLVMTTVLAFWLGLRALSRPTAGRYAFAGLGFGLAISSKVIGGLVAVPFALASLVARGRALWRLGLLSLAGATAAATYIALNPDFRTNLHYLGMVLRFYSRTAEQSGGSHLGTLWRPVTWLLQWNVHGTLLGVVCLVALIWLGLRTINTLRTQAGDEPQAVQLGRLMLVTYPIFHAVGYAIVTPTFKNNNFVPILPFTAIAAAYLLILVGDRLMHSWPRRLRWASAAIVGVLVALPAPMYVYRSIVPTTLDQARSWVWRSVDQDGQLRMVVQEEWVHPVVPWEGSWKLKTVSTATRGMGDLKGVERAELDAVDAEIFRASTVAREPQLLGERFADRPVGDVKRFAASPFTSRGPELVAVLHKWRASKPPVELDIDDSDWPIVRAELPMDIGEDELLSLACWLPESHRVVPKFRVGGVAKTLYWTRKVGRGHQFVTDRQPAPSDRSVEIEFDPEQTDNRISLTIYRWDRGYGPSG